MTPKTIRIYFKVYEAKRKRQIQDMWLQGSYIRAAIISAFNFGQTPPPYPPMPYAEEEEKELAKNEDWVKAESLRAYNNIMAILTKNTKGK